MNKVLHAQIEVSENLIEARQIVDAAISSILFAQDEGLIDTWNILLYCSVSRGSHSASAVKRQLSKAFPVGIQENVKFSISESHQEQNRHRNKNFSEDESIVWFLGNKSLVVKQTLAFLVNTLDSFNFSAVDARRLPISNFKDFGAETAETTWVDLSCSLWRNEALAASTDPIDSKFASLFQSFVCSWKAVNNGHRLGHCSEAVYFENSVHFLYKIETSLELLNLAVSKFMPIFEEYGLTAEQACRILEQYIRTNKIQNLNLPDKLQSVIYELGNHFA